MVLHLLFFSDKEGVSSFLALVGSSGGQRASLSELPFDSDRVPSFIERSNSSFISTKKELTLGEPSSGPWGVRRWPGWRVRREEVREGGSLKCRS